MARQILRSLTWSSHKVEWHRCDQTLVRTEHFGPLGQDDITSLLGMEIPLVYQKKSGAVILTEPQVTEGSALHWG
jgi:hypothetical protein